MNLDKSCYMYFPSSRKLINLNKNAQGEHNSHTVVQNEIKLFIGRNQIKEVAVTLFLGIQFDPMLNWSTHIEKLRKKLITCFAVIKRISTYIPITNYKNIFHTLFEAHISYCISVWGGAKKSLINKLFTVQKRAIRYLFGDKAAYTGKFFLQPRELGPLVNRHFHKAFTVRRILSHYSPNLRYLQFTICIDIWPRMKYLKLFVLKHPQLYTKVSTCQHATIKALQYYLKITYSIASFNIFHHTIGTSL